MTPSDERRVLVDARQSLRWTSELADLLASGSLSHVSDQHWAWITKQVHKLYKLSRQTDILAGRLVQH
jgi:hypothetical protein